MAKTILVCALSFLLALPLSAGAYAIAPEKQLPLAPRQAFEIELYAESRGVPFEILAELLRAESDFDPNAIGRPVKNKKTGKIERAYGIAQFMESTAAWVAPMGGLSYEGRQCLFDPVFSCKLAVLYLQYLQYGGNGRKGYGDWHKTLTAYNRGVGGLQLYEQRNSTAVSAYSSKILDSAGAE